MSRIPAALAAAAIVLATATGAYASEVSKKASELWGSIKAFTVEKKDDALSHGSKLLKDMDAEIGRLEAKAGTAKGDAKAAYQKQVAELKAARATAGAKLEHLGKQTGAAWSEAKDGFADAYRDLHHAVDKAAAKIK